MTSNVGWESMWPITETTSCVLTPLIGMRTLAASGSGVGAFPHQAQLTRLSGSPGPGCRCGRRRRAASPAPAQTDRQTEKGFWVACSWSASRTKQSRLVRSVRGVKQVTQQALLPALLSVLVSAGHFVCCLPFYLHRSRSEFTPSPRIRGKSEIKNKPVFFSFRLLDLTTRG